MKKMIILFAFLAMTAMTCNAQSTGQKILNAIVDGLTSDGKKDTPTHKYIEAGGQVGLVAPKNAVADATSYSWSAAESSKVRIVQSSKNSCTVQGLRSTSGTVVNYKYNYKIIKDGREKIESATIPFTITISRIDPEAITIDQETTVGWGITSQLHPRFTPQFAEAGLSYDSDNTDVVRVNTNGVMTGISLGEANVRIRTSNGLETETHVTCVIPAVSKIEITGHDKHDKLYPGDELQLGFKYGPEHAEPSVTWSSNNTEIATVDENGLVKIVGHGTVHIYCTDRSGAKDDIKLKPKKAK